MTNDNQGADLYAKQVKIQNRWVSGFYQTIRSVTIWITLGLYFIGPWLQWHGRQSILFDIKTRKFYLFNLTFWPQDFYLVLLLVITSALSLIVVTTIAGRLWCGYTCPQTVWTKCYMWIEYMVEGDRGARLELDKNPWKSTTVWRRGLKHGLWLLLALYTAVTFVGYFFPIHQIFLLNISGWGYFWIAFFTLATYINAGWMREQVCLYICPYARFQSVMFDPNTMVISYDYHRGEPRGSLKEEPDRQKLGSCIDCQLCVQVCPTGIDIRESLQLECIGCAACVDACNSVMDKVNFPRGLIRYDTENRLNDKKFRFFRPRLVASMCLLALVFSIFVYLLISRVPLQFSVIHDHQNLYRVSATHLIENAYVLSLSNMSQQAQTLNIQLNGMPQAHYIGPTQVKLLPGETTTIPVTLTVAPGSVAAFNTPISFNVQSIKDAHTKMSSPSNFFNPR